MTLYTKQKATRQHRGLTFGCQGGGKDWECGISRCKLLYIGWINNKVLLHSTGNYTQYLVKNYNGKEYICITELLCCTEKLTQH